MNTVVNLGTSQMERLAQVLSQHLSRNSRGKQIISEFAENREHGQKALLAYLNTHLPEDETLTKQIAEALGEEYSEQFITVVAGGGNVGEIINIGQLDKLTIRRYVFSTVWQVIALLLGVVVVGGAVAFGLWWSSQPPRMTGDFNIAVAEFVQTGGGDPVAAIVSQRIFSFLDGQYKLSSFEAVQVAHDKIGVITSAQEARALAEKINAHVVIYGDVTVVDDQVLVSPQFYVIELHQSDVGEVNGEHKLAARIGLSKMDLINPSSEALKRMQRCSCILTEFTKALVYLSAGTPGDLILASESIEQAIDEAKRYGDFEGKEVLYLFASDIARRQKRFDEARTHLDEALRLNDNYGRAYIAKANIYYDQGQLYQAMKYYEQAKTLSNQPFGAYIIEKASLGLGNSCSTQYQHVRRSAEADPAALTALANCALENYQIVITSCDQQVTPEACLREMAAWAYYGSGIVYQEASQFAAARRVYEQVLTLTQDLDLLERAQRRLGEVEEK